MSSRLIVKKLPTSAYAQIFAEMKNFTLMRTPESIDELWLLEHKPVFTQGQAGKPEHVLFPGDIPVVQSDRGGQVTYHGPGQLMFYPLVNIDRLGLSTRCWVRALEQLVIDLLATYQLIGERRNGAPGVYVDDAKIASIGLRVKKGASYHGLSLNVDMDLEPFRRINPCGYQGLKMTHMANYGQVSLEKVAQELTAQFCQTFAFEVNYVS